MNNKNVKEDNMKNRLIFLITIITIAGGLISCVDKLTIEKVDLLVKTHPFLKEMSVAITDKYLPDCTDDLLGEKKNGYILHRGYTTAYYYKMHDFEVLKVENLIINEENNTAECQVLLAPKGITEALKQLQKKSWVFKPSLSIEGEYFNLELKKFKDKGWSIVDFYHATDRYFDINGWINGAFVYHITPNSYDENGKIAIKKYAY